MTINIICETTPGFSFHYKKLAESVIEHSLDTEGFPYEAEVNLTLVDEERIHEINLDMRQIDAPTDVLSFPMIAYEYPADFDGVDDQLDDCVNPDTGEVLLGDIVICVPRVYQQAEEYGHSVKREYAFLITHSMLHLMGYDHMVPEEAELMEAHQRKILDTMGITR
ncbi:rRNA maturation RNase YbeY [uncultured Eubacterium sp.]|uniref:rRNA maturation RNase YbeY n=1 Tax=uncultured Eubacterium sp. TaxID=165185 RepID=UPI0025E2D7A3|nr:rRNA maturation RNase YbeY [uncultured Eubacterium sp.]